MAPRTSGASAWPGATWEPPRAARPPSASPVSAAHRPKHLSVWFRAERYVIIIDVTMATQPSQIVKVGSDFSSTKQSSSWEESMLPPAGVSLLSQLGGVVQYISRA